jgi:hypothetical protein
MALFVDVFFISANVYPLLTPFKKWSQGQSKRIDPAQIQPAYGRPPVPDGYSGCPDRAIIASAGPV